MFLEQPSSTLVKYWKAK